VNPGSDEAVLSGSGDYADAAEWKNGAVLFGGCVAGVEIFKACKSPLWRNAS